MLDLTDAPKPQSVDDFEICRELREQRRTTGVYEALDTEKTVKEALQPWETIFLQFKDEFGKQSSFFYIIYAAEFLP